MFLFIVLSVLQASAVEVEVDCSKYTDRPSLAVACKKHNDLVAAKAVARLDATRAEASEPEPREKPASKPAAVADARDAQTQRTTSSGTFYGPRVAGAVTGGRPPGIITWSIKRPSEIAPGPIVCAHSG